MIKITCISDTHNKHKSIFPGSGDLIIHAGDATGRGHSGEIEPFLKWYGELDFTHKILIAGNHDFGFERDPATYEEMCKKYNVIYLNDTSVEIKDNDTGKLMKVHGSPVQPEFCDWAFNRRIGEFNQAPYAWIKPHWDLIPEDTNILVTHGPPKGIMDEVKNHFHPIPEEVGCPHLFNAVKNIKPQLHVFGHIHEQNGVIVKGSTTFCNASMLNDRYNVAYTPWEFEWDNGKITLK